MLDYPHLMAEDISLYWSLSHFLHCLHYYYLKSIKFPGSLDSESGLAGYLSHWGITIEEKRR